MSLATYGLGSDTLASFGMGWSPEYEEETTKSGEMLFDASIVLEHSRDAFFLGEYSSIGVVSLFVSNVGYVKTELMADAFVRLSLLMDGYVSGLGD